jgi:hypothetical protein
MKGTLHKTEQGWVVKYPISSVHPTLQALPLHPDEDELKMVMVLNVPVCEFEGKEVDFEIKPYDGNSKISEGWGGYAKLIPSKEEQKQLITEIMDLDAKDGLYDTVSDLDKLAEETFKGDDATTFVQREIWKDGYRKAKETLYTEEQVRKVIEQSYSLGSAYRGVYSKKLENEIIQSLKQLKKD